MEIRTLKVEDIGVSAKIVGINYSEEYERLARLELMDMLSGIHQA
jgi:hypothetical protein